MKYLDIHFDWHAKGLFCVMTPGGELLTDTASVDAYSARSTFSVNYNKKWSKAMTEGYVIFSFEATAAMVEGPKHGENFEVVDPRYAMRPSVNGVDVRIICSESGVFSLLGLGVDADAALLAAVERALVGITHNCPFELQAEIHNGDLVIFDLIEWQGEECTNTYELGHRLAMLGPVRDHLGATTPARLTYAKTTLTTEGKRALVEAEEDAGTKPQVMKLCERMPFRI